MKKILGVLVLTASIFAFAVLFTSCVTVGVAVSGGKYFDGKKEEELVKYFKYEGDIVKTNGNYDKVMLFSNLVTTVYVDKTTTEKFKNRRFSTVSSFNFYALYDGCYIYPQTQHYGTHVHRTDHVGGKVIVSDYKSSHTNNNTEINSQIKSFNSAVQQHGAVKKINDNAMFERTNINETYYIYDIQSNRFQYSDNEGTGATEYKYILQKVSVYEDSKSFTETHIAYIYNDREKSYTDEKGNAITKETALQNEKSYISEEFSSRKKNKGLALIAYIKDGVVVKVETVE